MASLYFKYSTMNAGKSSLLLQSAHNYKERGMKVMLFNFAGDNRYSVGTIASRIGLSSTCNVFNNSTDFTKYPGVTLGELSCILIDEAQFLTEAQVLQLSEIVDYHNLPVMCYGITTDFKGQWFEGSSALMRFADKRDEIKTICHCGRKAHLVLRVGSDGKVAEDGAQLQIGGNDSYISVCRKHFFEKDIGNVE